MMSEELRAPYRDLVAVPWAPIVSTVHIFDRPILPARFVGMIGTATQWAFDRGVHGEDLHQVGTIRSAAFRDVARDARVWNARVFKERRATMRSTPHAQPLRPSARTAVAGLLLAGDWTDTGLPPTIEGAVASGHRAAALLA
jgi:uncharacterized protein with NAD-binding domain and iron-sulfur cluster